MINKISVNVGLDHTYECKHEIIGRAGEGYVTRFEIKLPDKLCDCSLFLDFEKPNGETYRTPKLAIKNGVATYDVHPFILTDSGEVKVQVVSQGEGGETWKTNVKTYTNIESINVSDDTDGYIKPSGTFVITESGTYDVTLYKNAEVTVGGSLGSYQGEVEVA